MRGCISKRIALFGVLLERAILGKRVSNIGHFRRANNLGCCKYFSLVWITNIAHSFACWASELAIVSSMVNYFLLLNQKTRKKLCSPKVLECIQHIQPTSYTFAHTQTMFFFKWKWRIIPIRKHNKRKIRGVSNSLLHTTAVYQHTAHGTTLSSTTPHVAETQQPSNCLQIRG